MTVFTRKSLAASKYALQSKYLFKITTFSESMWFSTQLLPSLLKPFIQKQTFLQERNKWVIESFIQATHSKTLIHQLLFWIIFISETNALTMLRLKYTLFSITWSNIAVVILCSVDTSLFSGNKRWWLCLQIELVSANRRSRTLWLILSCLLNTNMKWISAVEWSGSNLCSNLLDRRCLFTAKISVQCCQARDRNTECVIPAPVLLFIQHYIPCDLHHWPWSALLLWYAALLTIPYTTVYTRIKF